MYWSIKAVSFRVGKSASFSKSLRSLLGNPLTARCHMATIYRGIAFRVDPPLPANESTACQGHRFKVLAQYEGWRLTVACTFGERTGIKPAGEFQHDRWTLKRSAFCCKTAESVPVAMLDGLGRIGLHIAAVAIISKCPLKVTSARM